MNKEALKEALEFAKEQGLASITVEGITMTLGNPRNVGPETSAQELNLGFNNPDDQMTDEELLYYATPYYEELQAMKKQKLETKTQDEDLRGK